MSSTAVSRVIVAPRATLSGSRARARRSVAGAPISRRAHSNAGRRVVVRATAAEELPPTDWARSGAAPSPETRTGPSPNSCARRASASPASRPASSSSRTPPSSRACSRGHRNRVSPNSAPRARAAPSPPRTNPSRRTSSSRRCATWRSPGPSAVDERSTPCVSSARRRSPLRTRRRSVHCSPPCFTEATTGSTRRRGGEVGGARRTPPKVNRSETNGRGCHLEPRGETVPSTGRGRASQPSRSGKHINQCVANRPPRAARYPPRFPRERGSASPPLRAEAARTRTNDMAPKIEEIDDMPPLEDPEEEVEEFTGEDGTVRRGPDRSFADLHLRRSSSRKSAPPTRAAYPDDRPPTLERAGRRRPRHGHGRTPEVDGAPSIPVNPRSRANPRVSLRPDLTRTSHARPDRRISQALAWAAARTAPAAAWTNLS